MSKTLVGSNIIIVAQHFNPSVLSQLWLVRHGLVAEDGFEPNCLFSDGLVQVLTKRFQLTVLPNQLQFILIGEQPDDQRLVEDKIGGIVKTLPHTPFRGVGLNFFWHQAPEVESLGDLTRRLFYRDDIRLFDRFRSEDSHFGAYASKDIFGCRLGVDVKPIKVMELKETRLQFAFNYHRELSTNDDPGGTILEMIGRWDEAKEECGRILSSI